MCEAVDLMEDAFKAVADDGNQLLDEAFMMGIYEPLMERFPPLKKYMTHMFEFHLIFYGPSCFIPHAMTFSKLTICAACWPRLRLP